MAGWLYRHLESRVDKLIVCDARRNHLVAKDSDKDDPIDAERLVGSVMRPSDGAYVLFEGVVRNHHEGKAVESIFYDAYRPMAEKEIAKVVDDVQRAYEDIAIAGYDPLPAIKAPVAV